MVTKQPPALVPLCAPDSIPTHSGIRTIGGRKYVEYAGGKKELYSLARAPGELNNRYPAVVPSAELVSRLHALKRCAGDGCRVVEDGP